MKDVVELLLTYSTVDPRAKNNWALILAKENNHDEVYQLLAERSPEKDAKTGQIKRPQSSQALLLDLINADSHNLWKEIQQRRDLKLLLETSTTILPDLEGAISEAIRLGKTELAKMMLFLVAFDNSYFNHIIFFKQLKIGNSFKDLRKIDPFLNGRLSIFTNAVRSGNVELATLILDKALKLNPIQPFLSGTLYGERAFFVLEHALDEIIRQMDVLGMDSIVDRLERIFEQERLAHLALSSARSLALYFGYVRMCHIMANILEQNIAYFFFLTAIMVPPIIITIFWLLL
jgi:hypothetical protein